eukprot:1191393-Prorocentrum_minimum.AAC.2
MGNTHLGGVRNEAVHKDEILEEEAPLRLPCQPPEPGPARNAAVEPPFSRSTTEKIVNSPPNFSRTSEKCQT